MGVNRIGGGQPPSYNPSVDDVRGPSAPASPPIEPAAGSVDGVELGPSHAPMFDGMEGVEMYSDGIVAPIIDDDNPPGVPAPIIDDDGPSSPIIDD